MHKVTRREFLRLGVVGPAAAAALGSMPSWGRHTEYIPAIVIGSGFGGAVASLRLAEAGIHTLVLERGKRWPIRDDGDTFATFEKPDGRAAWLCDTTTVLPPDMEIDIFTGVLELISAPGRCPNAQIVSPNMDIRNGAGVGGGSLVYNSILLQPRREIFERVFPRSVNYDEMDQIYYPRVREIIDPQPIPDDILATKEYLNYRVIEKQADTAGFTQRPMPLGINWDVVRQEFEGTRVPSAIAGQSWYGLNSGAQKSVDKNYLRMAEETGYVEVLPLHLVAEIRELRRFGLYLVSTHQIDTSGRVLRRQSFVCKHLFLAAGSPGTTALLVKAKAMGALQRLSPWVGKDWGTNGEFILVWGDQDRATNPGTGGPAAHTIVEAPSNDPPTAYAGLVVPPPIKDITDRRIGGPSFAVGMGITPPAGAFRYDWATGRVVIDWPGDNAPGLQRWRKSTISMRDRLFRKKKNNLTELFFSRGLTGHPVGGAVMEKVCNTYGNVKRYSGLYVVDGAVIPGSTGVVNPALTIAALAERSMERIIAGILDGDDGSNESDDRDA